MDRYLDQVDVSPGLHTFEGLENLFSDIIFQDENYERAINADKIHEMADQYSVYKFVYVVYGTAYELGLSAEERLSFPSDKSYTDQACIIGTIYVPACEESIISMMASQYSYDAISGEAMDFNKFKESVDKRIVDILVDQYAEDDPESRREWEKVLYARLYMMENHKFDLISKTYVKSDDEKRLWYVRNFNWDTNTDAPIDLSAYRNSGDIYCAAECNYNSDTAEYFESELDRALYLANRDYKADTGENFGGTDDKRLWFMQNYSYDTSSGKTVDKEIVDALIAYQKYVDEDKLNPYPEYGRLDINGYTLDYINDDNIPECMIWSEDGFYSPPFIMSYINGEMQVFESTGSFGDSFVYFKPKSGLFEIYSTYGRAFARDEAEEYVKLSDDFETLAIIGTTADHENGTLTYRLNDEITTEEMVNNVMKEKGLPLYDEGVRDITYDEWIGVDGYQQSLLAAYDILRTTIYETYEYCIYEYELKDGVLTVKADDGANTSSSFGTQTAFEFSCPVVDDCIWEAGYGFGEDRSTYYSLTSEELEVELKNWRNMYELTPDNMESPVAVQFHIIDDQVVGVYTSMP